MDWLNEPQTWSQDGDTLTVTADGETDFWRVPGTHSDNGHLIYQALTGDFTATVKFQGDYGTRYDQAGLMLRESDTVWLKAGVELETQGLLASVVLTRGYSDWGFTPLPDTIDFVWFRAVREGGMINISYSLDGETYALIRQGFLTETATLQVGMMCAAPQGGGFQTVFEQFAIETK
ncbi:MAG: DUF1349 domain-containing protein [Chloroflexota bacterium]